MLSILSEFCVVKQPLDVSWAIADNLLQQEPCLERCLAVQLHFELPS
jgi:hypothetical protein